MFHSIQQVDRQWVVIFALLVCVAGFFLSRVLISIGMILLVANAVLHPNLTYNLRAFFLSPIYLSTTIIFLIVLISGLYSSDIQYWLARMRVKAPLLLLPFAFAFLKPFNHRKFYITLYIIFGIMVLSSLAVMAIYLGNIQEIANSYKKANVVSTPFHHIRYSLMLAFCIAIGLHCYVNKISLFVKREPLILLAFSFYLFLFLHFMAVRSGMLAAYIVLFVFLIHIIFTMKQYIIGSILFLALLALPVVAYLTLPTLQNKVKYMTYDLQQFYYNDKVENLSDARRIISFKMGVQTGMQQPLLGVGYGDIKYKVKELYKKEMPNLAEEDRMLPHNQFILVFVGAGLIGLILFMVAVFYPLLTNRHYREPLFLSFNLIVLSSFMTEYTLEVQIGTAFYVLFLLFLLKQPAFAEKEELIDDTN